MNNSLLAEALARIEHKIDIILESQAALDPKLQLRSVGDSEHYCPICQVPVSYQVDLANQSLKRSCACSTGMQSPINLQSYTPTERSK